MLTGFQIEGGQAVTAEIIAEANDAPEDSKSLSQEKCKRDA